MARKRKRTAVKRRSPEAAALARAEFRQRIVANKKKKAETKRMWLDCFRRLFEHLEDIHGEK